MVDFPKNNRYVNLANQSINELADNNFGTRLKAGDTTKLSYLLLDGNGDSLDLEGFTATAVLKKDNLVAYKKDATLINDDGQYRCEFKITDVLEPSEKAYVVEFVLTKGEDKYIYPSDNDIPLTIEPSSLSAEEDIIRTSSEEIITGIIKGIPAIAKVDEHITNLDVHVTAEDKAKWQTHSEEITRLNEEKQTKLVAGDNVVINQETNEISVNVPDDVVRKNSSNQIELTDDPTSDNHATRKSYVDRKFSEVDLSDYARADHTHTSSDISDSITRIGTVASANKLIKTDSDGFIDFIAPSDSSPDKTVILKGYLDTKLGQKANSDHNHDSSYYQKIEYISDPGASDKANKPLKSNTNGGLTLTNPPTENTDAVNKLYVDSKVADISLPDSGMTQAQADERYIRSNAATSTLGRHLTVDASDDGNYSASLFLKKNSHQYEFYTNATGKFGAWDKTNERNLFSADRNSFRHDTNVDMANNRITNLPEPNGANQPATKSWTESQLGDYYAKTEHVHTINSTTNNKPIKTDDDGNIHLESTPSSNHHIANKQYVDGQIDTVLQGIPGALGAAGFISQENADARYARTEHTHVSADITDTITAIGTVASANKIVKTDSTGFLNITADPTSDNHVVRKSYVDRVLREARPSRPSGTVNGITQSDADSRYARTSHTHDSADITNTTNRIGTSASANKVVKLDSRGFLDVVTPNDNSPGNSVIVKSYLESKLNEKASASELETLRNTITQLQNKIQTLEANAGKVKNSANDTYLDIWVGPENQKPSDSTDKLVFVEKG